MFKYFSLITYIGILMTACIMIGFYLGTYLERLTGSFFLFILGIFLGIGAGFWSVYQLIAKL
ncbi:AtpZ/AtpI family protein [Anaerobranca gottschalkii]|nr:AtpZ/AtpI family protein [Anaerobranca gottschalkii]